MNRSKQNSLMNIFNTNENLKFISIGELILFILYNLYFILTKEYKLYNIVNTSIYISITIGISYICLVKTSAFKNLFIQYLGIEYIFIAIFTVVNLSFASYRWSCDSIYYCAFLATKSYFFEFLIVCLGFYFTLKEVNIKKIIILYAIIAISNLILLNKNNLFFLMFNVENNFNIIILNIIIVLLLTVYTILIFTRVKNRLNIFLTKTVYIYITLRFLSYISNITLITGLNKYIIIGGALKLSAFYILYKGLVTWMISNSIEHMRESLEVANKVNLELHRTIKKRNRILNDTNIMIEKSQSKYNKLINSVYDGVFLFSSDKLEYINKTGLKLLNYINKEDILGVNLEDFIRDHFDFCLEEFSDKEIHISDAKMKSNTLIVDLFIVYVDINNRLIYIHDVTELNKTKIMRNKLEKYLQEEKLKNQFFSNVSHELRTPINLIYSAIQLNDIYLKQENIVSIRKNNKIIKQNSLRLIRTINNFIDTNKVSEGYLKPDFKNYNIVEVVENISIACNKYINKAEITLIFDSEEEEIYVRCDKDMIERIILNIISNSVKYGKSDGQINVNINIKGLNTVVITVQNDGYRIEQDTIPYVFDKFTKINKSFNRLREGSGLGLFLTKALIELQEGSITLTSNEEENLFTITFPISTKNNNKEIQSNLEMNNIEEKVDVEFSDIYID